MFIAGSASKIDIDITRLRTEPRVPATQPFCSKAAQSTYNRRRERRSFNPSPFQYDQVLAAGENLGGDDKGWR